MEEDMEDEIRYCLLSHLNNTSVVLDLDECSTTVCDAAPALIQHQIIIYIGACDTTDIIIRSMKQTSDE